ncbi:rRNA methyltransferase 1, mitochondrial-like [Limulus polyphemus]|uniref:rRNA methyltransferase 1, mitochondrial n=1 Tax=Limulus polyphemus TaxID=6850 RepID=A0ABM1BDZ6_LIMPO|nr:rRNA methyltransferase 1, mitochondrial-like [Limulus polyphemus]
MKLVSVCLCTSTGKVYTYSTVLRTLFMYNWKYVRFMSKIREPKTPQSPFTNSSSFQKNKFRFTNLEPENSLQHHNQATNRHPKKGNLTSPNLYDATNFMQKTCNKSVSYSLMSEDLVKKNNSTRVWRDDMDKFEVKGEILYGLHPVSLALKEKRRHIFKLFVKQINNPEIIHKEPAFNHILELALAVDVPVQKVSRSVLDILSKRHVHQGVCLDVSKLKLKNEQEVFLSLKDKKYFSNKQHPVWLVLDQIQDPMNFGAVLRSAYYFGIDCLLVVRDNSCRLSPVVSKASAGSLEVLDLYQVNSLPAFLRMMKQEGWNIVGTRGYSEKKSYAEDIPLVSVEDFILAKPTVIIIGSEGRGVSSDVHDLCDTFLTVSPGRLLHTDIESLNVSVATGIILHRLLQMHNS